MDYVDANTGQESVWRRTISLTADVALHDLPDHVLAPFHPASANTTIQQLLRYILAPALRYDDGSIIRWLRENLPSDVALKLGFQALIRLGPFLDSRPVSEHGVTFLRGNDRTSRLGQKQHEC